MLVYLVTNKKNKSIYLEVKASDKCVKNASEWFGPIERTCSAR